MNRQVRIVLSIGIAVVAVSILMYGISRAIDSPGNSPRRIDSSIPPSASISKHELDNNDSANPDAAQTNTRTATIDFGEYGAVDVEFREPPYDKQEWPISLSEVIDDLEQDAIQGSVSASLLLHKTLSHCQTFPYKTKDAYDEGLITLQETQTYKMFVRGREVVVNAFPEQIENFSKTYAMCDGITPEQEEKHVEWLKHAADLGDPQSASDLGGKWLGNTTEGRAYLKKAFEGGWYDAAWHLGIYNSGVVLHFANVVQPVEDVANDNNAAYAYMYLYSKLLEASGRRSENFTRQTRQKLKAIGDQMSPYEVKESTQLAARILREQSNCCYSRLPAAIAKNRAVGIN